MAESSNPKGLSYQIKKLGKHGAIYGLGTVSNKLIAFLLIPLYLHFLTPADYGVLQLVSITIEVISVIIGLRLSTTVFRFYHETNDSSMRKIVVSTALLGVLIMGTTMITPIFFLSPWVSGLILHGKEQSSLIQVALISLWLQMPLSVVNSYIQVKEKSLFFISISISRLIATGVLNVYFVAVMQIGVLGILLSTLIVDIITSSILIPYFISMNSLHFSWYWGRKMLRFSLPLIPSSLASMITHASDRYFIRGYFSLSATGVYSLGYKMGNSIHSLFYVSFSQIWNARRFAIEKEPNAPLMYAKICTYFISIISFVGLGMSLFARDIVTVISPEKYSYAANIMPLIVLCYVIYAIEDHVSTGIWLSKKTERITLVNLIIGGLNIGLNFLLIPLYGMYGAVVSTLITFLLRDAGLFLFSKRLYPIPFEWLKLFFIFIICIILYLVSFYFSWMNFYLRFLVNLGLWMFYPIIFLSFVLEKNEKIALWHFIKGFKERFFTREIGEKFSPS